MSKIVEKRVIELGHFKDPFNREEFTANDIFDACVECYDQAMQDFLEKAKEFLSKNIQECLHNLNNTYKMKAKIKKTGEIVNLASYATITLNMCDSWGNPIEMKPEEIELIQDKTDDFDWQSFRAEAAKDILCAMIQGGYDYSRTKSQSELSVKYADELIKQLKEKEEK